MGQRYRAAFIRGGTSKAIVFRLEGFMVPAQWSQVAADILAQKYFRKAGLARRL